MTGVILPQPALRGEMILPGRIQRQGPVARIHGDGAGASAIHPDADHVIDIKVVALTRLSQRQAHRLFESI